MTPALEIRGLVHRYGAVRALDGLDLVVEGPGVFGLLGVNGAGKSTTMRVLNGFLRPEAGLVRVRGEPVRPEVLGVRRHLGYLPQTPAFPGWMTGREVLVFAANLAGVPARQVPAQVDGLLDRLGLADAAGRRASGYSGGMRQRLGLAQALVGTPDLLLLDEPVSALDPVGRAEVLALVEELGQRATVFMSSHILGDVERVADRVAIVHKGRVVADEATDALRARFLQPLFELEVSRPVEPLLAALAREGFVESATPGEAQPGAPPDTVAVRVRVRAAQIELAARRLPALVAEAGLGLYRLERASPSLEEAFLHVIEPDQTQGARP